MDSTERETTRGALLKEWLNILKKKPPFSFCEKLQEKMQLSELSIKCKATAAAC